MCHILVIRDKADVELVEVKEEFQLSDRPDQSAEIIVISIYQPTDTSWTANTK